MSEKVWFVTGASRGFGRIWAEDALKRGDKVVATARSLAGIAPLADEFGDAVLPLSLDVTNRDQVADVVAKAHAHFGRLDIVLNNAGYALVGAIEEASEADVRAEFDTNVFGPLAVIQAAVPLLRAQHSGHIIGVSSVAGVYAAPAETRAQVFAGGASTNFGDPAATSASLFKVVDSEQPPLRFFLGTEGLPVARAAYAERLAVWESWEDVSNAAQGQPTKQLLDL